MSETIRTFIAIELPEKIIDSIRRIQERLQPYGFNVRWVRPQNIHLTLKFLGNIQKVQTEKINQAIFESAHGFAPISIAAKGIGAFPSIKRPRVIWVGLVGQINQLQKLQKTLDEKLAANGFPKEKRKFKGHLTLGRVKNKIDPQRLFEAVKEFAGFESEPFVTDTVALFKSELKPTGAVYTKLMETHLMNS
ncbi:MAG: RNA 2',3'-cyclic phosphodiesterase [Desulfobacterales bacterium]|uniref:RNA 2',3'-cyclic phosphodiesterase n=1 Tax=Candidatus Desulfatibia vada TaxID=2841696 RepID=A0A8J6NVL7_9BACT|nr:RNA 2',3'-cyclic phosphodiesterase [Candidatus Desulfatibia vada]